MKRLMLQSMFAAAAFAAVAASAHAQILTAEIPFAFRAGATAMSPGAYDVRLVRSSASHVLQVRNLDTHQVALIINMAGADVPKAWRAEARPKLGFECADGRCVLRQVWTGDGPSMKLNSPKPGHDDAIRLTEIRMNRAPGF